MRKLVESQIQRESKEKNLIAPLGYLEQQNFVLQSTGADDMHVTIDHLTCGVVYDDRLPPRWNTQHAWMEISSVQELQFVANGGKTVTHMATKLQMNQKKKQVTRTQKKLTSGNM
jgi:hypothetical protein